MFVLEKNGLRLIASCSPYHTHQDLTNPNRIWVANYDGISSIIYDNEKGWIDQGYIKGFKNDVSNIRQVGFDIFFQEIVEFLKLRAINNPTHQIENITGQLPTANRIELELIDNQIHVGTENGIYRYESNKWEKIHFENYMDISNCTVHLLKKLNNNQIWAVLYNIKDYHRFYTGYFTIQNGKYIWHQTAFQNIVNELFNDFALDNEGRVLGRW